MDNLVNGFLYEDLYGREAFGESKITHSSHYSFVEDENVKKIP